MSDSCPPRKLNGGAAWIAIGITLLIAVGNSIYTAGSLSAQVGQNSKANDEQSKTYVPRSEIDAKLATIQVHIGAVQANVMALKEQSERQTREILLDHRKLDRERRNQ